MRMLQDDELLVRAVGGDRLAMEGLLHEIRPQVLGLVRRGTDDWDQAEDVTQEILLKVVRYLGRLRTPGCFVSWLYRVVSNEVHNSRRRKHRQRRIGLRWKVYNAQPHTVPDPARAVDRKRLRDAVGRLVRGLPEDQRNACRLVYVDGLRSTEAAGAPGEA